MTRRAVSVQDTAYWVAYYRALESERPDAIFNDPYARALAGERGRSIVEELPRARQYGWPMVVRTAVMDEIVLRLADQVDAVLNLAAGLDARPYRLALPAALAWFDVDFTASLDHKAEVLRDQAPRCRLERIPLDLADTAARRQLFARFDASARSVLVITEGLLTYLSAEQAGALAADLSAHSAFAHWLTDVASPFVLRMMQRTWGRHVDAGGATFKFAPDDAAAFFAAHGWRVGEYRAGIVEGQRFKREFPLAWLFRALNPGMWRAEAQRRSGPMAGVLLLHNTNPAT